MLTRPNTNETLESLSARLSRINRANNTSRTESLTLFKKIKNGKITSDILWNAQKNKILC